MLEIGTKILIKKKSKSMCGSMWEGVIVSHQNDKYYQVKITDAEENNKLDTRMFSKEFIEDTFDVVK